MQPAASAALAALRGRRHRRHGGEPAAPGAGPATPRRDVDGRGAMEAAAREQFLVDGAEVAGVAATLRAGMGGTGGPAGALDLLRGGGGEVLGGVVRERYARYVESLRENSPRILLVGDSGLGKSACVNVVFGFHPDSGGAEVRAGGRPCTQRFAEYGPTDFAPVRVIDSKGVEKMAVAEQMKELRGYIRAASAERDVLRHVHLVWYFIGDRWQEADLFLVRELMEMTGVVVVLSKRDQRTEEGAANLKQAVRDDLGDSAFVAEVGDPRGTRNWIPSDCGEGHGEEWIEVNMRSKTWRCVAEVAIGPETGDPILCERHGDDSPFGHRALVHASLDLLPKICRQSFLSAQRVDMSAKHTRAAAVIGAFTASAAGVGAVPIPFADLPVLLAMEASMAASLIAVYGVPFDAFGADQLIAIHSGVVGVGGAVGYFTAQVLKGIPGLNIAGSSIDMMIAATAVATLGVAMSVVLTRAISADTVDVTGDAKRMIGLVASRVDVGNAVRSITRGGSRGKNDGGRNAIQSLIENGVRDVGREQGQPRTSSGHGR
jgi:uncharacterized protein (DUF697 family)/energy-coupling factor transporter ATP-binding protein EcfA2